MTPTESVKCPTCSGVQVVDADAVGYSCVLCGSDWQWALCLGCSRLELALAGQESWKCTRCSRYTRSWWRSTTAADEALRIAEARLELRTRRIRARGVAPRRRRRRILSVATAAVALIVASVAVVLSAGGASADDHDRAACSGFERARSTIANGAPGDETSRALAEVRAEAVQGTPAVAAAVVRLVEAGRPGTAAFLVAQTKVVQACG